jgi:hypothetical protein
MRFCQSGTSTVGCLIAMPDTGVSKDVVDVCLYLQICYNMFVTHIPPFCMAKKTKTCSQVSFPIVALFAASGLVLLSTVTAQKLSAQTNQWTPFDFRIRDIQWIDSMPAPVIPSSTAPVSRPAVQPVPIVHSAPASVPTVSSSSTPATNQCANGLQVCRCYCRADIRNCVNNQTSVTSLPLCRDSWSGTSCPSIGFFSVSSNAQSCEMQNGQRCEGFIRPGDAPAELIGQKVQGAYLGCGIVGL